MPFERIAALENEIRHLREQQHALKREAQENLRNTEVRLTNEMHANLARHQEKLIETRSDIHETQKQINNVKDILDKINSKLTIHNFVLVILGAILTWAGTAFFKSMFDRF